MKTILSSFFIQIRFIFSVAVFAILFLIGGTHNSFAQGTALPTDVEIGTGASPSERQGATSRGTEIISVIENGQTIDVFRRNCTADGGKVVVSADRTLMKGGIQRVVCEGKPSGNPIGSAPPSLGIKTYSLISPIPGIGSEISLKENTGYYFQTMFKFALGIAGILAVLMIVIGGIQYMMSEAFTSKEDAKKRIWGALWGLLLLFASVIILQTINPALLNLQLKLTPLGPSAPPTPSQPGYAEYQLVEVPPNRECPQVKGSNWETLKSSSCTPPPGKGQKCCGRRSMGFENQGLPETQIFSRGDQKNIENFKNQCIENGGRFSTRCTKNDGTARRNCIEEEYKCSQ